MLVSCPAPAVVPRPPRPRRRLRGRRPWRVPARRLAARLGRLTLLLLVLLPAAREARAANPPVELLRVQSGAFPSDLPLVRSALPTCPKSKCVGFFGGVGLRYEWRPFSFQVLEQNGESHALDLVGHRLTLRPTFGIAVRSFDLALTTSLVVQDGEGEPRLGLSAPEVFAMGALEVQLRYTLLDIPSFAWAIGGDLVLGWPSWFDLWPDALASDGYLSGRIHMLVEPWALDGRLRFPIQISAHLKPPEDNPVLDRRLVDLTGALGVAGDVYRFGDGDKYSLWVSLQTGVVFPASHDTFDADGAPHRAWFVGAGVAIAAPRAGADQLNWSADLTAAHFPLVGGDMSSARIGQLSGGESAFGPYGTPPVLVDALARFWTCPGCPAPTIECAEVEGEEAPTARLRGEELDGPDTTVRARFGGGPWHEDLTIDCDSGPGCLIVGLPRGFFPEPYTGPLKTLTEEEPTPEDQVAEFEVKTDCGEDLLRARLPGYTKTVVEKETDEPEPCRRLQAVLDAADQAARHPPDSKDSPRHDSTHEDCRGVDQPAVRPAAKGKASGSDVAGTCPADPPPKAGFVLCGSRCGYFRRGEFTTSTRLLAWTEAFVKALRSEKDLAGDLFVEVTGHASARWEASPCAGGSRASANRCLARLRIETSTRDFVRELQALGVQAPPAQAVGEDGKRTDHREEGLFADDQRVEVRVWIRPRKVKTTEEVIIPETVPPCDCAGEED